MDYITINIEETPEKSLICHPVGTFGSMNKHIGPIIKTVYPDVFFNYRL
jgi:hypothetical protein